MSSCKSVKIARKHYYEMRMRDVLIAKRKPCSNCGKKDIAGHYVPASFGEPGFFICEAKV